MGWPRKNEVFRIYREKDKKSYMLVMVDKPILGRSGLEYGAIANASAAPPAPSLVGTEVSRSYVLNGLKRMAWDELPEDWQLAFREYMSQDDEPFEPANYRGLWRVR